jgi:hypothetical protein
MPRNFHKSTHLQTVTVTCVDNNKSVKATLIKSQIDVIIVELENGLRLTMYKSPINASSYIGSSSGLEFVCKPLEK